MRLRRLPFGLGTLQKYGQLTRKERQQLVPVVNLRGLPNNAVVCKHDGPSVPAVQRKPLEMDAALQQVQTCLPLIMSSSEASIRHYRHLDRRYNSHGRRNDHKAEKTQYRNARHAKLQAMKAEEAAFEAAIEDAVFQQQVLDEMENWDQYHSL